MTNNNTSLNLNLTDYSINQTENKALKFDIDCIGFVYSEVLPINTIITDSTIDLKKVKKIIIGNNQIYYISDSEGTNEYIEKNKTFFNDFQFYEVKPIDLNNKIPSQTIITIDTQKQDKQNITDIKKIDYKPNLSPSNDNINTFDYNNISIYDVCDKLNIKELKTYPNYKTFECFNKTAHKKGGAFTIYNNKNGFECFNKTAHKKGGAFTIYNNKNGFECFGCGVNGANNIELVKQVLNCDSTEAIKWLKENFDYSDSNYSGTSKQSEPEPTKTPKNHLHHYEFLQDMKISLSIIIQT